MKKMLLLISMNFVNLIGMHIYHNPLSYPQNPTSTKLEKNPFLNTQVVMVDKNNTPEKIKGDCINLQILFNRLNQNPSCFTLEGDTEKLLIQKIHTDQDHNEEIKVCSHSISIKPVFGLLFLHSHCSSNEAFAYITGLLKCTHDFTQVSGPLSQVYPTDSNTYYYGIENMQLLKHYPYQIAHNKIPLFLYKIKTACSLASSLPLTISVEEINNNLNTNNNNNPNDVPDLIDWNE